MIIQWLTRSPISLSRKIYIGSIGVTTIGSCMKSSHDFIETAKTDYTTLEKYLILPFGLLLHGGGGLMLGCGIGIISPILLPAIGVQKLQIYYKEKASLQKID